MTHSHGGVICPHATKKSCDLARKAAMGQCAALIDSKNGPYPCKNWATDAAAGRNYCGVHITSVLYAEYEIGRAAAKRAELDLRIDLYMAWRKKHPSVWERMAT